MFFFPILLSQLLLVIFFLYSFSKKFLIIFDFKNIILLFIPLILIISSGFRFYGYSIYDDILLIFLTLYILVNYSKIKIKFSLNDKLIITLLLILLLHSFFGLYTYKEIKIIIYPAYFVGLISLLCFLKINKINYEEKKALLYFDIVVIYFLILTVSTLYLDFTPILFEDFISYVNNDRCLGLYDEALSRHKHFHQCLQNVLTSGSTLSILPIIFGYLLIYSNFHKQKIRTIILIFLFISYTDITNSEAGHLIIIFSSILILILKNFKFQFIVINLISIFLFLLFSSANLYIKHKVLSENLQIKHSVLNDNKLLENVFDKQSKRFNYSNNYFNHINKKTLNDVNHMLADKNYIDQFKINNYGDPELLEIITIIEKNIKLLDSYNRDILNLMYQDVNEDRSKYPISNYEYKYLDLKKYFGSGDTIRISTGSIGSRLRDIIILLDTKITNTEKLFGNGIYSSRYKLPKQIEFSDMNLSLFIGKEINDYGVGYSLKKIYSQGHKILTFGENMVVYSNAYDQIPTMIFFSKFIYDFGLIAFAIFLFIIFINIFKVYKEYIFKDFIFLTYILLLICSWSFLTDLTNNLVFYALLFYSYIIKFFIKNKLS